LDYARQAVEVYRRYPDSPILAETLYEEALLLADGARPREAEPLLAEAIQVSAKLEGDPNTNLPRFYAYLCQTRQALTEFAGAEESCRKALEAARKINGEEHVDTLETELRLGMFLSATSRMKEGLEHIERAKDILLRTRGADDPFFAPQVFLEYGRLLTVTGHLEDGLTYVTKAVENRRKNRPGTAFLGQMLGLQAYILVEMGHYAEGERLMDEAEGIFVKVNYPVGYPNADGRARLLMATGRANEAEPALERFHPSTPPAGALALDALKLQTSRAEVALARGDAETAKRLAGQVIQEFSASTGRDYVKASEARAALVQGRAELQLGRPSEALQPLQRAVELRQAVTDPVAPALAAAQVALAECYLDLGDLERAKVLAVGARKALAAHPEVGGQYLQPLQKLERRLHNGSAPRPQV
jgi:serine/threonine-protein kinase